MNKVKVIDHDGTETVYEARTREGGIHIDGGITAVGYLFTDMDDVDILIHPEAVKRIEIYEGDELCRKLEQRSHKPNA